MNSRGVGLARQGGRMGGAAAAEMSPPLQTSLKFPLALPTAKMSADAMQWSANSTFPLRSCRTTSLAYSARSFDGTARARTLPGSRSGKSLPGELSNSLTWAGWSSRGSTKPDDSSRSHRAAKRRGGAFPEPDLDRPLTSRKAS